MTDNKSQILVTGAHGMLGRYLTGLIDEERNAAREEERDGENTVETATLGLSPDNTYTCDLRKDIPSFGARQFDAVFHCAGSNEEKEALAVNHEGTLNLLKGLEKNPPKHFVYISSYEVYSHDAGEDVAEDRQLWATSKVGQSKALAETALREWCGVHGTVLTILRPARMFGTGVKGEMLRLFNDAVEGHYIHIRGNEARLSVVTALDVARFALKVYRDGGVYNLSDGVNPRLLDLVEAMTENLGARKRPVTLPPKWAALFWKAGRIIPLVDRQLNPEVIGRRSVSMTLDNAKAKATGFTFHDTIEVIARRDKNYPYETPIN